MPRANISARAIRQETALRERIEALWRAVNWNWHTKGEDVLYWHRSPKLEREPPQTVRGWNECLITYVLAASSPTYPIAASAYHEGWAKGDQFTNGKSYYGIELPLGPDYRRTAVLRPLFVPRPRSA